MKAVVAISVLLVAAAIGAAQETSPAQPAVREEKPNQERGSVNPQKQCEWIAKERPELAPVQKACEAAVAGFETLPNFVCDMRMTRKEPLRREEKITAQLRFIEGEEELSDLAINGKPSDRLPENGSWTQGAFAPPGLTVLDGRSAPQLTFRGEERSPSGAVLLVVDYRVAKAANQSWTWNIPPYQYRPGFHGVLRIDKQSGQLRSVSLVADDIDTYVPTLSASETTEYNSVRIGDFGEYLLPVHSEMKSCGRFSPGCSEIVRDFGNCRKFAAKAKIIE
jgi:hypothetical protein